MNRRILKKLSKKAVPLLESIKASGIRNGREVVVADRESCITSISCSYSFDRKHWERRRVRNFSPDRHIALDKGARSEEFSRVITPTDEVLAGTPLIGGCSGYETPEWEDRPAWDDLSDLVHWSLVDWEQAPDQEFPFPVQRHDLSTPYKVLKAARDLAAKEAA